MHCVCILCETPRYRAARLADLVNQGYRETRNDHDRRSFPRDRQTLIHFLMLWGTRAMCSHQQGVVAKRALVACSPSELSPNALVLQWQGFIAASIRRLVRSRRARRICDEDDLRQSVSLALLIAARHGQLHADCPQQLAALIERIATNQLNATLRSALAVRRDFRRTQQLDCTSACKVPDPRCDPAATIEDHELQQVVNERLDATARRILYKRELGLTWGQIAAEEPDRPSPESIRKMFVRNLRPIVGRYLRANAG